MRLLKINLLVAALMVFSVATASAYRVDMSSAQAGGSIAIGSNVTLDVTFNTEGGTDVVLMSVGVVLDDTKFAYDLASSSNASYKI
jgi:hypothetical protein